MRESFQVFNDPDVILAQTQAGSNNLQIQQAPVAAGAVASIGGATGNTIAISSGASGGFAISPSGAPGVLTLTVSVSNAATVRTALGLGGLAVLDAGAAVPNSAVVAGAAYSQTDFQSVIDKLNALLTSLRNADIIAT